MTYRIELRPAAVKALRGVAAADASRLRGAIALLAVNPRPPAALPLRGRDGWRLRVGNYRILYIIEDERLVIVVVTLGHRRDVYR